jgi:hypothetical protein
MAMQIVTLYLTIGSALAVSAGPQKRDLSAYSFADFTSEFNKSYLPDEHARRELVFARKLASIMAHNAGDSAWVAGVNRFTDWTDEEFSSFARGMRSQHKLPLSGMGSAWQPTGKDIPASVDWRNKSGVVTAVKDQARPCTCSTVLHRAVRWCTLLYCAAAGRASCCVATRCTSLH